MSHLIGTAIIFAMVVVAISFGSYAIGFQAGREQAVTIARAGTSYTIATTGGLLCTLPK